MKIVCHREGLLSACQLVNAALPSSRDVVPVLQNIKAVVSDDGCTLVATDNEVGIRMEVRSVKDVVEPGEALLPATRLLSILRESTDDEMTIEANPDSCLLRGEHARFEMPGDDPDHYPDFPTFAEDAYHEIAAGVLREMIRRTQFAVAGQENAKYGATTGILWELEDKARLVATDGRRLALAEGPAAAQGSHTTEGQMPVVPIKAMTLLERNLQEPEETVRVCIRPNEVLIKTERSTIYSRLVEGRFPPYRQILPKQQNVKIPLQVGAFQTAIRQAAIMTDEDTKRVVFGFATDRLTLQARGSGTGSSEVEMPLQYSGEAIDISFDPRFLLEMLRVLDPEAELTLELIDSNSPVLFRNDEGDYSYVVVPMVVNR